ncbi:hypothetical protein Taro_024431, partial [Colocasia esculenta]|nr:hypothetical protein [Colocasia esculenta]
LLFSPVAKERSRRARRRQKKEQGAASAVAGGPPEARGTLASDRLNLEDGILKWRGTSELDCQVVATLCGVVERLNKLVYVRALRARLRSMVSNMMEVCICKQEARSTQKFVIFAFISELKWGQLLTVPPIFAKAPEAAFPPSRKVWCRLNYGL